jgi:hypothetical protein
VCGPGSAGSHSIHSHRHYNLRMDALNMDTELLRLLSEYQDWMGRLTRRQREWLYLFAWRWQLAESCYDIEP